jgi:hypothetical protein
MLALGNDSRDAAKCALEGGEGQAGVVDGRVVSALLLANNFAEMELTR